MAEERKSHDVVLPEVRKPAGYGTLVSVVQTGKGKRELWFQHRKEPEMVRCVEIDFEDGKCGKPLAIKTKAERER